MGVIEAKAHLDMQKNLIFIIKYSNCEIFIIFIHIYNMCINRPKYVSKILHIGDNQEQLKLNLKIQNLS